MNSGHGVPSCSMTLFHWSISGEEIVKGKGSADPGLSPSCHLSLRAESLQHGWSFTEQHRTKGDIKVDSLPMNALGIISLILELVCFYRTTII